MRTALADFRESGGDENGDNLTRLENGDIPHRLRDRDVLDTDKLRLQVWLAVFKEQGDHFLKVMVKFVERSTLRVGTGKAGDKPHKKLGMRATFDYG